MIIILPDKSEMHCMKNLLVKFLFVLSFCGCNQKSNFNQIDNLTVLHLTGSYYKQGLEHGRFLRIEINDIIGRWKKEVESAYNQNFKEVVENFFITTSYIDVIKDYCPELLDEVLGMSEGSGIEYETLLAFQMSEEMDALSDDPVAGVCTSISVCNNGSVTSSVPSILAQNMDPPKYLHGHPTLLHITDKKNDLESYIYTFPGFIGLCGLNSKGVAITCNGISMLNHSKTGLPVSFIVRAVLSQNNEREAFELLRKVPVAVPQCFTIGGINEIKCFECSANQKKEFYPFENDNITLHTNFAAANSDFNKRYIELLKEYGKSVSDPYFCPRYFLAYDEIKAVNYNLNFHTIKQILSLAKPEIEPISNDQTYGCLIMELTNNPVLNIAPGRPDSTEFIRLTF